MKEHWTLDPDIAFLNHGSFGATPRLVLEKQNELRAQMEREPVRFFARELEPLTDDARHTLAEFVGADAEGLAFVPNATFGVNAVLRSLDLDGNDELLVSSHEYNACRNTLDYVAGIAGAKVVVIDVPFPIASPDVVVERVLDKVTSRTRLLLIDHITSQTALILPVQRIIAELQSRGIDTLVDGAHAPGHLPLDLRALGAAYYAGNLHKWVCAPKGAAFLYVRENRRASVRPAVISHGATSTRRDRSRFLVEFDWTGTHDPTPYLCVPESLRVVASFVDGGWPEVMRRNHELALRARDLLCETLQIDKPAPDAMLGCMAAVPLPDGNATEAPALYGDPVQDRLLFERNVEVPFVPWPHPPKRLLRVSAQLYNTMDDYQRLAAGLREFL
ncbi:MAG: aminotransferase class V-fold PLP-dependent enzyme [Acidobacteria bacterium]|nr:aminotransferase class V-fold PLP-dependent enzyme [Acidobacteriota bacterium]MBV9477780.1 aminotransferase class V-fold PLP-dependent enzyme [Acidobacteriota bacterium]